MYNQSSKLNPMEAIKMFQISLQRISTLSQITLDTDYEYFLKTCGHSEQDITTYIENIFICNSKIALIASGVDKKIVINKNDLNIPSNKEFIHKCYLNSARELYNFSNLFSHKYSQEQQIINKDIIQRKIKESFQKTISSLIPISSILKKYVMNNVVVVNNLKNYMDFNIKTAVINQNNGDELSLRDENINKVQHILNNNEQTNNEYIIFNEHSSHNEQIDDDVLTEQCLNFKESLIDELKSSNPTTKTFTKVTDNDILTNLEFSKTFNTQQSKSQVLNVPKVLERNEQNEQNEPEVLEQNEPEVLEQNELNEPEVLNEQNEPEVLNEQNEPEVLNELNELNEQTRLDNTEILTITSINPESQTMLSNFDETESFLKFKKYINTLDNNITAIHIR